MLRGLSTRSRSGYERLGDESGIGLLEEGKLKRAKSVPMRRFSTSKKIRSAVPAILEEAYPCPKQAKRTNSTRKHSHPLFSFCDGLRRKKKATAKPEFARYLEYLKEGGKWDASSNMPVIYYK